MTLSTKEKANLKKLLLAQDDESVKVGLTLLQNQGDPKEFITELFLIAKLSDDAKSRNAAKKLLLPIASEKIKSALTRNIRAANRVKLIDYFFDLASDIDFMVFLQRIIEDGTLNLSESKITTLPPEIGQLQQLTRLDLKWCKNLTTLPPEIGQLQQLYNLDLCGCKNLTTLPPEIGQLQQLEILYLGGCKNLTALPSEISQLQKLRTLIMTGCEKLITLPPEIGQLPQLKYLGLGGCENLTSLPSEIEAMTQHGLTIFYR